MSVTCLLPCTCSAHLTPVAMLGTEQLHALVSGPASPDPPPCPGNQHCYLLCSPFTPVGALLFNISLADSSLIHSCSSAVPVQKIGNKQCLSVALWGRLCEVMKEVKIPLTNKCDPLLLVPKHLYMVQVMQTFGGYVLQYM